jgi:hypothetical protein
MDVENPQWIFDYNLFSVNPTWNFTLVNGVPPDPTKLCPVGSDDPAKWRGSASCTSDDIYLNQASGWNQFDCWVHGRAIQGHMNYFPVTYQGRVYWDSHSRPGGDDDYNFGMFRDDKALYTANVEVLHTEFDSDETVDLWDDTNTWWERFHGAVDDGDDDARAMVDGREAIVIALLGLDGGHADFKAELHPVYGMFIHVKADADDDQWAFFIRNWGDEGSCSNDQEYINHSTLFVEIPHPGAESGVLTNFNLWAVNFENEAHAHVAYQKTNPGMLLAFAFDDPHAKETYVGDLHFRWSGAAQPRSAFTPTIAERSSLASSERDSGGASKATLQQFDRLSPEARKRLMRQLHKSNPRPRSRAAVVPTGNMTSFGIENVRKAMAELKLARKLPNYRSSVFSESDPSIYAQKKRKLDLVTRLLNEPDNSSKWP